MSNNISNKTLQDLEFPIILDRVADFCKSDLGKKAVLKISPISDLLNLKLQLNFVNEYLSSFQNENKIPNHDFEEITNEIYLLEVENSYIEAISFVKITTISTTVNGLHVFLKKFKDYFPVLNKQIQNIEFTKTIGIIISNVITPFGEIKSHASFVLKQIRKDINVVNGKLSGSFNNALNRYLSSGYLDDIKESVVDNQRVLAVQSMHKRKVKGAILGNSKTGRIIFIAPESTLQHTRELRNLKQEEKEEKVKILKILTDAIRPFKDLLQQYQDFLISLDVIRAKAKYAKKMNACLPKINSGKKVFLRDAYHPILWETNKKSKLNTVSQTLELNEKQQIIVISGPNAGGKSITLKTIGLLQVMLQSGILIPVHEKSETCVFEKILTDIGDNQSIENQLSTYSYRLKNMRNFLRKCNSRTLFLIDEFGTGSDPELGGALAEIFLEEFYTKNAYGIITTHYANLKVLANELENVANANMQFDIKTLEPLFQLQMGQAGSSFTFEVAQKNGIPFSLINRAKKKVEREKIRLDKTISKLQGERNLVRKKNESLEKEQDKVKNISLELTHKKEKLQSKIDSFQELYDNNQKMLVIGRKINEFVNRYFQSNNKKQLLIDFNKWLTIEKVVYTHKLTKVSSTEKKVKKMRTIHRETNCETSVLKVKNPEKPSKRDLRVLQKLKKIEDQKQKEKLIKIEEEILVEVKKVRAVKSIVINREKQLKANYIFKVDDKVRLIGTTTKGVITKIEKKQVFISFGNIITKVTTGSIELIR
ncbi:MAG: DNA mismatch repair protein MutS [Flavobacteriaceae bacterium]|nr:DNA mismatch repair protein MutS [Flavobacteriaceae bacterium]